MAMVSERRNEQTRVGAREGSLFFADARNVRWQVFELLCTDGMPCLIFESSTAVRRVRQYPSGWRELSAPDLASLSWAR